MTGRKVAWIVGFILALSSVTPTASAQESGSWRFDIREEALETHHCKIDYFSHVVERIINGKSVVMAKVHCGDSRAFDAIRNGEDEFFTFTKCRERDERVC
ncbi:MAG: hypothetical protein JKY20_11570 [Alphaproteobacteria bacterium]|nr:hypothetical protein [Alphaproteobacteria bacterium]